MAKPRKNSNGHSSAPVGFKQEPWTAANSSGERLQDKRWQYAAPLATDRSVRP